MYCSMDEPRCESTRDCSPHNAHATLAHRCRSGTWFVITCSEEVKARYTAPKGRCIMLEICSMPSTWRSCLRRSRHWCVDGGLLAPRYISPDAFYIRLQVEVSAAYANSRRPRVSVLVVIAPLFLWLGAMSTVPHKEERFAYVVYTQVCVRHDAFY